MPIPSMRNSGRDASGITYTRHIAEASAPADSAHPRIPTSIHVPVESTGLGREGGRAEAAAGISPESNVPTVPSATLTGAVGQSRASAGPTRMLSNEDVARRLPGTSGSSTDMSDKGGKRIAQPAQQNTNEMSLSSNQTAEINQYNRINGQSQRENRGRVPREQEQRSELALVSEHERSDSRTSTANLSTPITPSLLEQGSRSSSLSGNSRRMGLRFFKRR
jgi:hypothetical protein